MAERCESQYRGGGVMCRLKKGHSGKHKWWTSVFNSTGRTVEWVDPCPNESKHTPCPTGYMQWHSWAARMMKTHRQERCPGCGLLKIWVPKGKRK